MKLGYIKLSPLNPSYQDQFQALNKAGCEVFRDYAGAKRPQLQKLLSTLQSGDTLVIWRLDCLATNLHEVITRVTELHRRGIRLHSVSEQLNTSGPEGTCIFRAFAALRQCERNQFRERFRAGMTAAKNRGARSGPKFKLTSEQITQAKALLDEGHSRENVADVLKVSRSTLYRSLLAHDALST